MNYRERLREDIKCPQFGDITYGRLGSLKYEDRKSIKRLLDEMDRADEVIKKQFFELNKQKEEIDKLTSESTEWEERTYCWQDRAENLQIVLDRIKNYLEKQVQIYGGGGLAQEQLENFNKLLEEIE